jgi:hypothetical protein
VGGLHLLAHHVAADRVLGEENDEGIRRPKLAVDLRHPIEADPDLLVEEDTQPPLLEEGGKPLRELLVRRDVPIAHEDLTHNFINCSTPDRAA